jgi:hypothetical protein
MIRISAIQRSTTINDSVDCGVKVSDFQYKRHLRDKSISKMPYTREKLHLLRLGASLIH